MIAGKSARPLAVGESALGGKFVHIFHRDGTFRATLIVCPLRRENLLRGVVLMYKGNNPGMTFAKSVGNHMLYILIGIPQIKAMLREKQKFPE